MSTITNNNPIQSAPQTKLKSIGIFGALGLLFGLVVPFITMISRALHGTENVIDHTFTALDTAGQMANSTLAFSKEDIDETQAEKRADQAMERAIKANERKVKLAEAKAVASA